MSNICLFQLRKGPVRRISRDLRGQKCNVMLIIVFLLDYNNPKITILVFLSVLHFSW